MYASYLIGEIVAEFLDDDDEDDIATSSRQRIIEDDPRHRALAHWLRRQVTRIGKTWLDLRAAAGRSEAFDNPLIEEWFMSLPPKIRSKADKLFGKIGQLAVDSPEEHRELFAQAVLGFENLRYRENLDALDKIDASDSRRLAAIFGHISDIQAAMYHRIVQQRLDVIDKLRENVDETRSKRCSNSISTTISGCSTPGGNEPPTEVWRKLSERRSQRSVWN